MRQHFDLLLLFCAQVFDDDDAGKNSLHFCLQELNKYQRAHFRISYTFALLQFIKYVYTIFTHCFASRSFCVCSFGYGTMKYRNMYTERRTG